MKKQEADKTYLSRWGESMYGGYYADIWVDGKSICLHADTQKELRRQLAEHGIPTVLRQNSRWDN